MTRRALVGALLLTSLGASLAQAYVVDARSVFRRFAERQALDRVTAGALTGRAQLAGPGATGGREVPVQVELSQTSPCRIRLELPEGTAMASYAGGRVIEEGAVVPALSALVALGCPLIGLHNLPASDAEVALMRLAGHLGVDVSTVSLSRLDRRASFVVGAHPRELDKPQLWFEKDTARPLRVVARSGGQTWDVRFEDPGSLATNRRAPRVAEVWRGAERLLSVRLMTADAEGVQASPTGPEDGEDEQE